MKNILIIFFLLVTFNAYGATQQVIVGGSSIDLIVDGTVEYTPWFGTGKQGWGTSEINNSNVMPTAGTIDDLRIYLTADPNNSGGSYAFMFRINTGGGFANTTLTCTVSDGSQVCNNSDGFSVAQGDLVSFQVTSAGTPTLADARWSVTWNPTVADESILLFTSQDDTTSTTEYAPMHGSDSFDPESGDVNTVMPTAGTFKTLYAYAGTQPGSAPDNWNVSFGTVDCDIPAGSTTCGSAADTQAVVAGDLHTLTFTETNSCAATIMKVGIVFDPTTEGEFIIAHASDDTASQASKEYGQPSAGDNIYSTTEADHQQLANAMTVKSIQVHRQTATGSGNTEVWTLRVNGADSSPELSCTVPSGSQDCGGSATVSISADDLLTFEIEPISTPAASDMAAAITGFITPTGGAGRTRRVMAVN